MSHPSKKTLPHWSSPPPPIIVENRMTSFDDEDPKYMCLCGNVHSRIGVLLLTLLSYLSAFILTIQIIIINVSIDDLPILNFILLPCLVIDLVEGVSKHVSLKTEKALWMIPSLILYGVALVLLSICFGFTLGASLASALHGEGGRKLLQYRSSSTSLWGLPTGLLWLNVFSLAIIIVLNYWLYQVQYKFYVYLRDKKRFYERTSRVPVYHPYASAPQLVEDQPIIRAL